MKNKLCTHLRPIPHTLSKGTSFLHHALRNSAGKPGLIVLALLVSTIAVALAGTDLPHPLFTWSLNPTDGNWSNAANWAPTGVPDMQSERAAFGSSSITAVTATFQDIHSVEFNPGASQYTITGGL